VYALKQCLFAHEACSNPPNGIRHLIVREYNSAASRTNEWGVPYGFDTLALTEDEKEMFRSQLSAILSYAERLQASLPRDAALANAPQAQDGFVIVPTVLEEHT